MAGSEDAADGLRSPPDTVAIYPAPPLAEQSRSYRVRVLGRPAFVERFAGVSYARFAMGGPSAVEIEVDRPIAGHAIFPRERIAAEFVAGRVLSLDLASPECVVVWIDGLEKLFLLPDPLEARTPVPGSAGVIDPIDFGADATGRRLSTTALQAAIDLAARQAGGGTVFLPRGHFRTGTLTLRSDVTLYLAPGSLLQGSRDPLDYPVDAGRHESAADESLPPDRRYLGRTMTFTRLLLIDGAENVRIAGRGTIDGSGGYLRTQCGIAPNLLRVRTSKGVSIRDVLWRDSAAWSLHVLASSGVAVERVKVINDRSVLNTDGIDVDMSSDVTVDRSFVYTKDDAVCVKATGNGDLTGDPRHILVTNSLVSSADAALKLGSESEAATFSDIVFEGNHVFESERAMSVVVRDGATYERVLFRGVNVGPGVDHLVEQVIGVRDPSTALGAIRDLAFVDVRAPLFTPPASNWTWYAQFRPSRPAPGSTVPVFEGGDDLHPLDGLTLDGVVVAGRPLKDEATARTAANLTIGPFVRNIRFE